MAGAGFKTFNTGDVLTASDVNTYLMQQTVMVFADSSARTTALGANVSEGMLSYLKDTKNTEYYNGTSWVVLSTGGDITGVTAGTGISGGGTSGAVTITNSMATAIDAKGDLIAGTAADTFSRLAVGANDLLLTAASGESTGLKYTGSWTTWTPTWTNVTIGNATVVARYCQIGKVVHCYLAFKYGSTSSISGNITWSNPITGANWSTHVQSYASILDAGVQYYYGGVQMDGGQASLTVPNVSGTYPVAATTSATVPFTWTTNDEFWCSYWYEVA